MPTDRARVERFLPLKPLVLEILLALTEGKRHGWSMVRDLQQQARGVSILPGNFYRTLRTLQHEGLIEEAPGDSHEDPGERRQYFRLTPLGVAVAGAEAKRLQSIVVDARTRRLLAATPPPKGR